MSASGPTVSFHSLCADEAQRARWRKNSRAYRERDPARHRAMVRRSLLRVRYGLTEGEFERMRNAQGGRCAICGSVEALHVDHCHATGQVRGLLCGGCNSGIGRLRDDPELLMRGWEYLRLVRLRGVVSSPTLEGRVVPVAPASRPAAG